MKKVRFESPVKIKASACKMSDSDCHSPRPFSERRFISNVPEVFSDYPRVLTYSDDPVQRFECSNSSPFPQVAKTSIAHIIEKDSCYKPSNDLDLSLLDASNYEPRKPFFQRTPVDVTGQNEMYHSDPIKRVLAPIENNAPPNVLIKDNNFFIRRDNIGSIQMNLNPLQKQFNRLSLDKENDPLSKKAELIRNATDNHVVTTPVISPRTVQSNTKFESECGCHHCVKVPANTVQNILPKPDNQAANYTQNIPRPNIQITTPVSNHCCYTNSHHHCDHRPEPIPQYICKGCSCNNPQQVIPQNAVDKKNWIIEKFEQKNKPECTEIEKQTNITKEKREPTVADLFKIIKLQNEQLQLLQEKVDKFITASRQPQPTITHTEHVAVTSDKDQVKMSIGVMTSFEMVHTSTVINKEVVKQTSDNGQVQCNRSQISINKVVSKPVNLNFLDGIEPVQKEVSKLDVNESIIEQVKDGDEKTFNDMSLYNVQIDNATTPLMSPEQTLYLDVRDYSGSEADSVDQSNVGWTYYNKVMTHVNGMLQDSEMPSSASAMFRNMRQHCVQMQIDKTNVSVTKRVKFGDDPLGIHQPHIYATASTDTSLKMNQLATKYLKTAPVQPPQPKPQAIEMSFATRNYMERHRLLQGVPSSSKSPQPVEVPRFLDITALKQQPKFL